MATDCNGNRVSLVDMPEHMVEKIGANLYHWYECAGCKMWLDDWTDRSSTSVQTDANGRINGKWAHLCPSCAAKKRAANHVEAVRKRSLKPSSISNTVAELEKRKLF